MSASALYEKLWARHVVVALENGSSLLYIDRHMLHEVSSPQAFQSLLSKGRSVRRPASYLAVADHAVPTTHRAGHTMPAPTALRGV